MSQVADVDVVVLRQWTPELLRFAWRTQKFKSTIRPLLPLQKKKAAKKELLAKRKPLSTAWTEKDVRYSYGMLTVVKKSDSLHLLKQWQRVMASEAVGGLSERQAKALFHVSRVKKVVAHIKQLLQDVSSTYAKDSKDLFADMPLSCGRVSLPAAATAVLTADICGIKRKADDVDEGQHSDTSGKRLHLLWVD